jgi:PKD repeat protein
MVWDVETATSTLEWTYYVPGFYDVMMEVEDEDGSKDRVSLRVTVTDVAPVADAGGPYRVNEGETLLLDGSASHEPGDHIEEHSWDLLDDGQYSIQRTGPQVEWSWDVAGTYEVTLYVTDADGSDDMMSVTVTVDDKEPTFNVTLPEDVEEGVEATYVVTDLADPGTVIFQVRWYFGDGASAEGESVTHTFIEDGIYRGNITVLDNDGTLYRYDLDDVVVSNVAPSFTMGDTQYRITEDEPFTLQLTAVDTSADTISFDFEGPGGTLDPTTGVFGWTPEDGDVGKNEFTFKVLDEDGGTSELVVTLDVEDVDNDFIGGMSTAGGSALILLLIIAVLLVAVLYMRYRGGKGLGGDDDEEEDDETVVILPQQTAIDEPTTIPGAGPAIVPGPAPTTAPAAATGEAASGDADQLPPPPPAPAGPQFNQVLDDRANESELQTDDETEPDHESEWEVID